MSFGRPFGRIGFLPIVENFMNVEKVILAVRPMQNLLE
jgi:hypothetical protein